MQVEIAGCITSAEGNFSMSVKKGTWLQSQKKYHSNAASFEFIGFIEKKKVSCFTLIHWNIEQNVEKCLLSGKT